MKKFLILSYSISGMGGGQMYQYNKLKYMREKGYDTYIFYAVPGEIVIKEIDKVAKTACIDVLNTHPLIIGKKKLERTIQEMLSVLGSKNTELIIECCNKTSSLWGEILAKRCNGFSYSLILDERIGSVDLQMKDFFRFKKERNELKGAKNETYEMLFEGEKVSDNYQYCLPIASNNVVADVVYNFTMDLSCDDGLKIGSIGRLDKAYVSTLVDEIIAYAKYRTDISIMFGMIGDSPNEIDKQDIIDKLRTVPNINLCLFGSMYPIPEKLLYEFDVFISSAGSARVSGDRGIPTITIDSRDYMAIGIYQYETENTVFRQNEPKIHISDKLKYLIQNYDEIKKELRVKPEADFESIFAEHFRYYESHDNKGEYYDVLSMKLSKGKKVEKMIYSLFGKKVYGRLRERMFARIKR